VSFTSPKSSTLTAPLSEIIRFAGFTLRCTIPAETVAQGVSHQVTTFTLSDFSRTFVPAGAAVNVIGSDHSWGSHHFVLGDSVIGGTFYGAFPDLVVGGNQDTDTGTGARGRWIPSSSVDEYASTLALWYGLSSTELTTVFPNIGSFMTNNLGFMMPS